LGPANTSAWIESMSLSTDAERADRTRPTIAVGQLVDDHTPGPGRQPVGLGLEVDLRMSPMSPASPCRTLMRKFSPTNKQHLAQRDDLVVVDVAGRLEHEQRVIGP
jgi:hypothetical protein